MCQNGPQQPLPQRHTRRPGPTQGWHWLSTGVPQGRVPAQLLQAGGSWPVVTGPANTRGSNLPVRLWDRWASQKFFRWGVLGGRWQGQWSCHATSSCSCGFLPSHTPLEQELQLFLFLTPMLSTGLWGRPFTISTGWMTCLSQGRIMPNKCEFSSHPCTYN